MSSKISGEELIQLLLSRRSIRRFRPETVDMDTVKRVLDVARYAPSAGNRQPWIFIIINDRELKSRLAKVHQWAKPLDEAPMGIAVVCNKETSPDSYQVDCANATMYIMLAAHALGLGTVWINTLKHVEEFQRLLNLPQNLVPVAILALGYPAESPSPRHRKSLSEITFINSYGSKLITA